MPRINLGKVVGPQGEQGPQGADGKAIEISTSATHIQWRYVGDTSWKNLIPLSDLQGEQGIQGEQGEPGVTGARGEAGTDGKSAFQAAVEAGYAGSEADFGELLASVQVVQTHPTAMSPHFQCYKSSVWGSSGTIALPLSWSDVVTETETATLLVEIAEEINISNSTLKVWIEEDSAFASVYGLDGDNIRDAHFVVGSFVMLKPIRSTTPVRKFYLLNGGTPSSIFTEALSEHDASDTAHRAQFLALASNKASSQRVDELEQEVALKANITDVYSKTEADNKFNVMVVEMERYGTATSSSPQRYKADKTYAEIKAHIDNGGTAVVQDGSTIYSLTRVSTSAVEFANYGASYISTIEITKSSTIFTPELTSLMPKAGGTFTGTVKAPTAAAGTNNTQIATTAFVQNAISTIPVPEVKQADWTQNDSNAADYIKNRTHYIGEGFDEMCPITTGVVLEDGTWETGILRDGEEYIVVLDGNTYHCVAHNIGYGPCYLGNPQLAEWWDIPNPIVTDVPFCIMWEPGEADPDLGDTPHYWQLFTPDGSDNHVWQVGKPNGGTRYYPLDERFIPDSVKSGEKVSKLVYEKITTSKAWIAPKAKNQLFKVFCVGGGGGGGQTYNTGSGNGGGGGGGGHIKIADLTIAEGTSITVTCGAGGKNNNSSSGATTSPQDGTTGGTTSFGSLLSASGGSGGKKGTSSTGGAGGAGGAGGGGGFASSGTGGAGGTGSFGGGGGGGYSNSGKGGAGGGGGTYGGGGAGGYGNTYGAAGVAGTYGGKGSNAYNALGANGKPFTGAMTDIMFRTDLIKESLAGNGGGGYGGNGGGHGTSSAGGGGGYCGNGGGTTTNTRRDCGGGGGGGYCGNGGEVKTGSDSQTACGSGGGGFFCNGGASDAGNIAGGGGGFFSDGTNNKGQGGNGGVLIMYFKED